MQASLRRVGWRPTREQTGLSPRSDTTDMDGRLRAEVCSNMRSILLVVLAAGAAGLSISLAIADNKNRIPIDYAAGWGECEIDLNHEFQSDNIVDQWRVKPDANWAAANILLAPAVDRTVFNTGTGSQRLRFTRPTNGMAAAMSFGTNPIPANQDNYPSTQERVDVQFSLRATGVLNMQFGIELSMTNNMGQTSWTWLQTPGAVNGSGQWEVRRVSFVVPQNATNFSINFRFLGGEGPVAGTFWIDSMRVTTGRLMPERSKGSLKLARMYRDPEDLIGDAAQYDLFIVPHTSIPAIKTLNPDARCLHYVLGWQSLFVDALGGNSTINHDLFPYDWVNLNHPEWFLTDLQGPRIFRRWANSRNEYLMDYGNPELRDHIFENLRQQLHRAYGANSQLRAEGLMFDNFSFLIWRQSNAYQTQTQRVNATQGYFSHLNQDVRNTGGWRTYTNLSRGDVLNGPYSTIMPLLDGYLVEGFMVHAYDGQFHPPDRAAWHLRTVANNPSKTAILLGREFSKDRQKYNYLIASYYLVNHSNVFVAIWPDGDESRPVIKPELFLPMGNPTSNNFTLLAGADATGALYARAYDNGVAVVNTSPSATFNYLPQFDYRDATGRIFRAGLAINVKPNSGLTLLRLH